MVSTQTRTIKVRIKSRGHSYGTCQDNITWKFWQYLSQHCLMARKLTGIAMARNTKLDTSFLSVYFLKKESIEY